MQGVSGTASLARVLRPPEPSHRQVLAGCLAGSGPSPRPGKPSRVDPLTTGQRLVFVGFSFFDNKMWRGGDGAEASRCLGRLSGRIRRGCVAASTIAMCSTSLGKNPGKILFLLTDRLFLFLHDRPRDGARAEKKSGVVLAWWSPMFVPRVPSPKPRLRFGPSSPDTLVHPAFRMMPARTVRGGGAGQTERALLAFLSRETCDGRRKSSRDHALAVALVSAPSPANAGTRCDRIHQFAHLYGPACLGLGTAVAVSPHP